MAIAFSYSSGKTEELNEVITRLTIYLLSLRFFCCCRVLITPLYSMGSECNDTSVTTGPCADLDDKFI